MDIKIQLQDVKNASRSLLGMSDKTISDVLCAVADEAVMQAGAILDANEQDLDRMDPANPKYDRLKLTLERIQGIAADMRNVAHLPSPVGRVLRDTVRPNGLKIRQVSVPFGVIGIIYEARPNVTADALALCLKSGNAVLLRGGSEAIRSNIAISSLLAEEAYKH